MKLDTVAVHAGETHPEGAVVTPIFQTAMFRLDPAEGVRYLRRFNHPDQEALATKLAALEGAEAAVAAASGMAAVTAAVLSAVQAGEHLLVGASLYGGTYRFVTQELPRLGIAWDFVAPADPRAWREKLRSTTRAFYLESLSNPCLEVPALEEAVAFGRAHGLVTIVDNTFLSPVNFRPCALGFDLVVESATKYLNGHSDLLAGVVAGAAARVERVRERLRSLGAVLDPHATFLLARGLKTVGLRVRRQNENALALARFLAAHARVRRVYYPGLPEHPGHDRAARLFSGGGGVVSFVVRDGAAAKVLGRLRLALTAPSLGGVETLVTLPAQTSHAHLPPAARAAQGIEDGLIRVACGIEDPEDLIRDFAQALGP